jgi:hypothetical protein
VFGEGRWGWIVKSCKHDAQLVLVSTVDRMALFLAARGKSSQSGVCMLGLDWIDLGCLLDLGRAAGQGFGALQEMPRCETVCHVCRWLCQRVCDRAGLDQSKPHRCVAVTAAASLLSGTA